MTIDPVRRLLARARDHAMRAGITVTTLSTRMCNSGSYLPRVEAGEFRPSIESIDAYHRWMDMNPPAQLRETVRRGRPPGARDKRPRRTRTTAPRETP